MSTTKEIVVKTKEEIINETVEYYNNNSRARANYNNTSISCYYLTDDGRMCAFGRCMLKEKREKLRMKICSIEGMYRNFGISEKSFHHDLVLKPEYRGHSLSFWRDIQDLHDYSKFWRHDRKLSEIGKSRVKELKSNYC